MIKTGLLDFHEMVFTIMMTSCRNIKQKFTNCQNYKSFSNEESNFLRKKYITGNHLPFMNRKYIRGNHLPLMNKNLSQAIILGTKIRNKILKTRNNENKTN